MNRTPLPTQSPQSSKIENREEIQFKKIKTAGHFVLRDHEHDPTEREGHSGWPLLKCDSAITKSKALHHRIWPLFHECDGQET